MITGEALDVILRIQGLRGFQAGMRQAAASTRQVGHAAAASSAESTAALNKQLGMMALVRKAAMGIGIALVGAGLEAYKLNTEFDKQLTMVQAEAGASASEVANMRKKILELSGTLRQSPIELAKGLYHIESLGFRGSKALELLKDSAHMANISGANLEETTTALGGAMIVAVRGGGDFNHTMGTLVATAGAGNMRMQNLVEALGTGLLSAAKNANMTLLDTGAALATLTDTGMPASSAAAQLRTALHFLYSPTKRARDALTVLGISQRDLVEQIAGPEGLAGALGLLDRKLNDYAQGDNARRLDLFGHILPGGRGQVLLTLMKNLDQYRIKHQQIGDTISHTATGIRISEQTNAAKIRGAWAELQATLISVADVYKGPLTSAIVAVFGFLATGAATLRDHKTLVLDILKGLLLVAAATLAWKTALVAQFAIEKLILAAKFVQYWYALAKAEGVATAAMFAFNLMTEANPIALIILGVAALVAGVVLLYMKWGWFHNAVNNTWAWIKNHWRLLALALLGPIGMMIVAWWKMKDAAAVAFGAIVRLWNSTVGKIHFTIPDWVPGIGGNSINLHIGDDKKGGGPVVPGRPGGGGMRRDPLTPVPLGPSLFVPKRPLAIRGPQAKTSSKDEAVIHNHIYLDGKEIESNVNKRRADRKARG